jgi:hypothetical protein
MKSAWRSRGCYKSRLLTPPIDSLLRDCKHAAWPRCTKLPESCEEKQNCIAEAVSSQRGGRVPGTPPSDSLSDRGNSPDQARNLDKRYACSEIRFSCTITYPFTAAELLRQLSGEHKAISRHEPLPPLESSSASPYEIDEGSHMSYGTHIWVVGNGFS